MSVANPDCKNRLDCSRDGLYNSANREVPLPGTSHRKENNHETCGQDVDPDGRFGLHVRGNRDPDTQC